jgi:hypothetical protein
MASIGAIAAIAAAHRAIVPAGIGMEVINRTTGPVTDVWIDEGDRSLRIARLAPGGDGRKYFWPSAGPGRSEWTEFTILYADSEGKVHRGNFGVRFQPARFEPHVRFGIRDGSRLVVAGRDDAPVSGIMRVLRTCDSWICDIMR